MTANFDTFIGGKDFIEKSWLDLESELKKYLVEEDIKKIYTAALYGVQKHNGQNRASGEPYFTHPLAVAKILAEQRFNYDILQAALLHDVLEDTVEADAISQQRAREEMTKLFGEKVTKLVDGVSKLQKVKERSPQETQAESLKKMIFAAAEDPAVVVIKLADRIHNMQTLSAFRGRRDKILRKARETMDIYAPIASNMGMFNFFYILQDYSFSYLFPWRYKVIKKWYEKTLSQDKIMVKRVINEIYDSLAEKAILARVEQRKRSFWNIYLRMQKAMEKHSNGRKREKEYFEAASKTMTLRIITENEDFDDCYRTLGIVHNRYKPIEANFVDYIANPKSNGYRTLRTSVITNRGEILNIHIRTETMHILSINGVVAVMNQNLNEELNSSRDIEKLAQTSSSWIKNLKDIAGISDNPLEFFEAIKDDIQVSKDDIHIYSPDGKIYDLKIGSTPLDFAYAVHKNIGDCFLKALVDGEDYEIDKPLKTGQTVKIITSPDIRANKAWLDFVVTKRAKIAINQALKKMSNHELFSAGQELFIKTVEDLGYKFEDISSDEMSVFLKEKKLTMTDFYCSIAKGERKLIDDVSELFNKKNRSFKNRFIEKIVIEAPDKPMVLAEIAQVFGKLNININSIFLIDLANGKVELSFVLSASFQKQLDDIYPALKEFKELNITQRKKI